MHMFGVSAHLAVDICVPDMCNQTFTKHNRSEQVVRVRAAPHEFLGHQGCPNTVFTFNFLFVMMYICMYIYMSVVALRCFHLQSLNCFIFYSAVH